MCMKKIFGLIAMLMLMAVSISCDNSDNSDDMLPARNDAESPKDQSLRLVARQSADAPMQYKAEIPLCSLQDIKSYNPETGEIVFNNVTIDDHVFYDVSCKYHICFFEGDNLLFDAVAVSCFSSVGYFDQLTFQSFLYPNDDDVIDTSDYRYYLRYGYPGTIEGDESLKELMKKNASGMERFIAILRQAGKIVYSE